MRALGEELVIVSLHPHEGRNTRAHQGIRAAQCAARVLDSWVAGAALASGDITRSWAWRSWPGGRSSPTRTSLTPATASCSWGPRSAVPGVIRGDLTPECGTVVRAVLEALGKKASPEDDRTEGQRFHDALQLACAPLPRAGGRGR